MSAENDEYMTEESEADLVDSDASDDDIPSLAAFCHDVQMDCVFDGQCERLCAAPGSGCLDLMYIESLWQEAAVEDAPVDDSAILNLLRCAAESQDDPQAEFEGMKHITLSCVSAVAAMGCSIVIVEKCPGVLRSPPTHALAAPRAAQDSTLQHFHIVNCNPVNSGVPVADGVLEGVRAIADAASSSLESLLLPGNNWPKVPLTISMPWPLLEALDLSGSSFGGLQMPATGSASSVLPQLRELSLARCDHLRPSDVYTLLDHCPELTHLDVGGIKVQWGLLLQALQACPQLQALAVGSCDQLWNQPSDASPACASSTYHPYPPQPPHLQLLTLSATGMQDGHLAAALGVPPGGSLAPCEALEMLDVSSNYALTVDCVAAVAAAHMGSHGPGGSDEAGDGAGGLQCIVIAESSLLEAPLRSAMVAVLSQRWGGGDSAVGAAGDAVNALEVEIHGQNLFWQAM